MRSKISVAAALLILSFGAYADSTAVTRTVPIPGNSVTSGGQATSAVKAFALPSNVCTSDNANCFNTQNTPKPSDIGAFTGAWSKQFGGQSKQLNVGGLLWTAWVEHSGAVTFTRDGYEHYRQNAVYGYSPVTYSYAANSGDCGNLVYTLHAGPGDSSEVNEGKKPTSWKIWQSSSGNSHSCGGE